MRTATEKNILLLCLSIFCLFAFSGCGGGWTTFPGDSGSHTTGFKMDFHGEGPTVGGVKEKKLPDFRPVIESLEGEPTISVDERISVSDLQLTTERDVKKNQSALYGTFQYEISDDIPVGNYPLTFVYKKPDGASRLTLATEITVVESLSAKKRGDAWRRAVFFGIVSVINLLIFFKSPNHYAKSKLILALFCLTLLLTIISLAQAVSS